MKWTPEQEAAIYEADKDILVAAAAGSGKTAVLVERIIQKMLQDEQPFEIDELLVATFTNAAAQEMRTRVGQALERALAENPDSSHLKKQIALLQRASISTLHAFCMNVVRKYSYQLDLDPGFRILDNVESDMLKRDVIESVFEDYYGLEETEQERFFQFVDRFSNDRNDAQVEELVLSVHEFALQNPWPFAWLDQLAEDYEVSDVATLDDVSWMPYARLDLQEGIEAVIFDVKRALELAMEVDGPAHYVPAIEQDLKQMQEVDAALGSPWADLHTIAQTMTKFEKLSGKKFECDEDLKERVKTIRNQYKESYKKLVDRWFSRKEENLLNDLRHLKPQVDQLVEVVKVYHHKLEQEKRAQAVVDFSDLEHYCLELLLDEAATPERIVPSDVAKQYQRQFREVLIDEYQDTNNVQETILRLLTEGSKAGDLFMVGDVKQSIYGFRHAEPSLFMEKYSRFQEADEPSLRIDLARNFRSRKEVLSSTNYLFRQLLDEQVGEMEYEEAAELIYSNTVYEQLTSEDVDTEIHLLARDEESEVHGPQTLSEEWKYVEKAQIEARAYVKKIQSWVGTENEEPMYIFDKDLDQARPVKYSDIVILMRSKAWFGTVMEELKQHGIPIYADLSEGYLEAIEIQVMLNVLKAIDNPKQDIPLASVLRSPIVGLKEDQMARIRLYGKNESFHQAVMNFIREGDDEQLVETLRRFFDQFDQWREQAKYGALSGLIWQIYRETGYFEFVGGITGGKQRQANLRALYDRARSYEKMAYRGLFRFLRFIEKMEERGDDLAAARALGEQEDVVRMMTIHSSKGLEFPIVILGAADKQFNEMDYKKRYLLHKDLGFAAKYMDIEKRLMYQTFPFEALTVKMKREMLAEEMRVLYVALTRAEEKLCIVGTVNDVEKRMEKWRAVIDHPSWVLPAHARTQQANYMNWIGMSLMRHQHAEVFHLGQVSGGVPQSIQGDESSWKVIIEHAENYQEPNYITQKRNDDLYEAITNWTPEPLEEEGDQYPLVDERLTFSYPYQVSTVSRAKQTVTELKRMRQVEDEYSATDFVWKQKGSSLSRPRFMQQDVKELTRAEIGSAMHTVMQHIDFQVEWTKEKLGEFLAGLEEKEMITDQEAEAVDYEKILAFLDSSLGQLLRKTDQLEREVPFTMQLNASDIYPQWTQEVDEAVLIQGVIDCLVEVDGKWYVIDYKTDTIVDGANEATKRQELQERYRVQVENYKHAVESIRRIELEGVFLYFFDRGWIVEID
ncbi:helicase-exonuclease AddAB subunit AddA [Halalkalibacillus halophilus]|uniref:helicase-exonuclease AddAB subunit AddA n=1 Tax=Halalkalibacillus halophilus TaxID=392827 RepID=UPI000403FF17|nr:helicase-exonuclease AddAB subunit AddA [Halalkalibacillus halophilus]